MTNWKSKYLEAKLKYINSKNKLSGGSEPGLEPEVTIKVLSFEIDQASGEHLYHTFKFRNNETLFNIRDYIYDEHYMWYPPAEDTDSVGKITRCINGEIIIFALGNSIFIQSFHNEEDMYGKLRDLANELGRTPDVIDKSLQLQQGNFLKAYIQLQSSETNDAILSKNLRDELRRESDRRLIDTPAANMIRCGLCGFDNPRRRRQCEMCGSRL